MKLALEGAMENKPHETKLVKQEQRILVRWRILVNGGGILRTGWLQSDVAIKIGNALLVSNLPYRIEIETRRVL